MFGPKKQKVSKKDIKKSIANANDRLRAANARMETDIAAKKNALQVLSDEYISSKEALEDIQGLQAYANNELEALQSEIFHIQNDKKKVLSEIAALSEEVVSSETATKKLKVKEDKLNKTIALSQVKKDEFCNINDELKAIKKEQDEGQETLSLLGQELNSLEVKVDSYESRKNALESDFQSFNNSMVQSKKQVEKELKEMEDFAAKMKIDNGRQMAKLDHDIADRLTELKDIDDIISKKKYEYSAMSGLIKVAEAKVADADEHVNYAVKKEQDKVDRIKKDFKDWKVTVLDDVAKMKLRKKMDNIDKAGLKEVLDG